MQSNEEYVKIKQSYLMLLFDSAYELFPALHLKLYQAVGKASYCEFKECESVKTEMLGQLKARMLEKVTKNVPFRVIRTTKREAYALLQNQDERQCIQGSALPLSHSITLCALENGYYPIYSPVLESTGPLQHFDLVPVEKGFLFRYYISEEDMKTAVPLASKKLIHDIAAYQDWCRMLEFDSIDKINSLIEKGAYNQLIFVAEAYHERKLAHIADAIEARKNTKVILVSGPSSSGKTTFASRLAVQLKVNGVTANRISMDDYFFGREKAPLNEDGTYNFEDLDALDYKLFNSDMKALAEGETVCLPKFNFHTGKREKGLSLHLDDKHILIVEGIHALNHKICDSIPGENKYKIYCTPFATASFDPLNPVSPTHTRLLRRLVRDSQFRNSPAEHTLSMWESVRKGELKNIFPFEETADAIFNSALVYEYAVIKPLAERLLHGISEESVYFGIAQRLLNVLAYYKEMPSDAIGPTSIMREFIGGSSFRY